jgi:hypothetical protein
MPKNPNHTPGKVHIEDGTMIIDERGFIVADCYGNEEDARQFVRAWNNYYALLEGCKKANHYLSKLSTIGKLHADGIMYMGKLQQAIVAAEKEV